AGCNPKRPKSSPPGRVCLWPSSPSSSLSLPWPNSAVFCGVPPMALRVGKPSGRAGCACAGLSLVCVLPLMPVSTPMPFLLEFVGHCQDDRKGHHYYTRQLRRPTHACIVVTTLAVVMQTCGHHANLRSSCK